MGRLLVALAALTAATPLQNPAQVPLGEDQPLVESLSLQNRIDAGRLWERATTLFDIARQGEDQYGHPTRVIGSEGHRATVKYIRGELEKLDGYYNVSEQVFGAVSGNVFEFRLVVGDEVPKTTSAMGLTPATTHREPVSGNLVLVAGHGCRRSDYPAAAQGNIALVKRGECSFGAKSTLAGRAGAVAAVVYNTDPGELHGTLGTPSKHQVATFGLGGEEGAAYAEALAKGGVLASSAYMDAVVDTIKTHNVVAQTVSGDADNCVMLGGHSDSVAEGPGINDDGSGSLSVLEVAVQLAQYRVKNCVRFAWWSAEEEGLLGSDYYVASLSEQENRKIRLFMDYDMMASPNFAYQVYNATDDSSPAGSQALRDLYIEWYKAHGLNHTLIPFDGRSDYDGFIRGGIPAGGIATGAEGVKTEAEQAMFGGTAGEWYDKNYHQLGDDLNNLNMTAWEVNTKLIAHSVATYAASFEGFPKRSTVEAHTKPMFKYHGKKLVM